jgi:hypothetical protein
MMQLIDSCLDLSIDEILASPDVAERVALYNEHSEAAIGQILRCSTVHDRCARSPDGGSARSSVRLALGWTRTASPWDSEVRLRAIWHHRPR